MVVDYEQQNSDFMSPPYRDGSSLAITVAGPQAGRPSCLGEEGQAGCLSGAELSSARVHCVVIQGNPCVKRSASMLRTEIFIHPTSPLSFSPSLSPSTLPSLPPSLPPATPSP